MSSPVVDINDANIIGTRTVISPMATGTTNTGFTPRSTSSSVVQPQNEGNEKSPKSTYDTILVIGILLLLLLIMVMIFIKWVKRHFRERYCSGDPSNLDSMAQPLQPPGFDYPSVRFRERRTSVETLPPYHPPYTSIIHTANADISTTVSTSHDHGTINNNNNNNVINHDHHHQLNSRTSRDNVRENFYHEEIETSHTSTNFVPRNNTIEEQTNGTAIDTRNDTGSSESSRLILSNTTGSHHHHSYSCACCTDEPSPPYKDSDLPSYSP